MDGVRQNIRNSGVLDALYPAEQVRHDAALRTAIDQAGRVVPRVAAELRPPQDVQWSPGDTGYRMVERAGYEARLRAYADTAPTTGSCIVTFSWKSKTTGLTEIGTVSIPPGSQFGDAVRVADIPASAWIRAEVTTANGAGGVSMACSIVSR